MSVRDTTPNMCVKISTALALDIFFTIDVPGNMHDIVRIPISATERNATTRQLQDTGTTMCGKCYDRSQRLRDFAASAHMVRTRRELDVQIS